jgi:thiamine-monophosphate kinase
MHEFELIRKLSHGAPQDVFGLLKGIGDDCAVIEGSGGREYLITTDALFEGVHFRTEWISPRTLGRKALAVNISDVAAMGGRPLYYLVTIGIPKGYPARDVDSLFEGMAQMSHSFRLSLIGGDTCASQKGLLLSLTVIGDAQKGKRILRSGARPGDAIFVTGDLGGSALGLACLENGLRGMDVRAFLKKHDEPVPRVAAGQWLAASGCVTSMIDISDGLVADLGHLTEEGNVGVRIFANTVPLPEGIGDVASRCHKDPLTLALTGGEDYELAFTVAKDRLGLFEKMLKVVLPTFGHAVTRIGEVVQGEGVDVVDMYGASIPLAAQGFEHQW